jgi:hypothetical protein
MKSKADKLLEQISQNGLVDTPTFWDFDGDLLDGKATWKEIIDGQECLVRLLTSALTDLEVNYSWPRSHFMRGIYLIIDKHGSGDLRQFKMRQMGEKSSRSYIYVPCLRAHVDKIQTRYNELFLKAKNEGTAGLGFPGSDWEYSRLLT